MYLAERAHVFIHFMFLHVSWYLHIYCYILPQICSNYRKGMKPNEYQSINTQPLWAIFQVYHGLRSARTPLPQLTWFLHGNLQSRLRWYFIKCHQQVEHFLGAVKFPDIFLTRLSSTTHVVLPTSHTQPLNSPLSGTTRVGQYQKKHSPTHTHPNHQTSFINFLHLLQSTASSSFNLRAWQSFSTTSLQVLFGLPLGLGPSTSHCIHFFTQLLSSFRNTYPYNCNLFCFSTPTPSIW